MGSGSGAGGEHQDCYRSPAPRVTIINTLATPGAFTYQPHIPTSTHISTHPWCTGKRDAHKGNGPKLLKKPMFHANVYVYVPTVFT